MPTRGKEVRDLRVDRGPRPIRASERAGPYLTCKVPQVTGVLAQGTDWAAVGAWAAWSAVGIYVVLGGFALWQVLEARRLREEQARPFVVVDLEPGFLFYLTVENLGRTMARDVRIQFDKPLESTLQGPREFDESPLFREPIPALPPGKKIRVLFDAFGARVDANLPLTYEVTLTYGDHSGKRTWKDLYRLDFGMYLGSELPRKGLPDVVAELERIRKEIEKWKGSGLRGLEVRAIDQRRQLRVGMRRMNWRILRERGPAALARQLRDQALRRAGLR